MSGAAVPAPAGLAYAAVLEYARACAETQATGSATQERSYYPALNALFSGFGAQHKPPVTPVSDPAARYGDFPDVACFEKASQACVLPVEVKPPGIELEDLARSEQPRRYARTFGGGLVLLCNLRQFALARLDGERLVIDHRVDVLPGWPPQPTDVQADAGARLGALLRHGWTVRPALNDPAQLAELLAFHAQQMTAILETSEPAQRRLLGPISTALHDGLGMELDRRFLNGTVVQTLVYGLFAAWLEDDFPQSFRWQQAPHALGPGSVASLLHAASDPSVVAGTGLTAALEATARSLSWTDRDQVATALGAGGGRAIEHFYEPFLAAFDPDLRRKLGVWYTPRAVADYQVARVHHELVERLGLADGLADPQAIVLDPACGTGTYLAAVLRFIFDFHLDQGREIDEAARLTAQAARERIIGFEILPAAHVICQLHLGQMLRDEIGAEPGAPLRLYLCNALTGWGTGAAPALPLPGLDADLEAALKVKGEEPVLAIIGNPPYEGYSAAETPDEQLLARTWTEPLYREWKVRKHRLGDLYVRFWRASVSKITDLSDRGVICFITNRKWLAGRSAPVMRQSICERFDAVIVDDLGGDTRQGDATDGSIFTTATAAGIQVGTAIVTAVRAGARGDDAAPAAVATRRLTGTPAGKRAQLEALAAGDLDEGLQPRVVSRATRFRLAGDPVADAPPLDEYFEKVISGVQPVRDEAVLSENRDQLERRMRDYFNFDLSWEVLAERHPGFAVTRARYNGEKVRRRHRENNSRFEDQRLTRILFRPLDARWLYWETRFKLLNEARAELWDLHRLDGQMYLAAPETPRRPGAARCAASAAVPAFESCDPNARALPRLQGAIEAEGVLDVDPEALRGPKPNIADSWLAAARRAGVQGDELAVNDTIFYALAAIMHSPAWAEQLPAEHDDFAGVPLPAERDALVAAAATGRQVVALQDPDRRVEAVTHGVLRDDLRAVGSPNGTGPRRIEQRARNGAGRHIAHSDVVELNDSFGFTGVTADDWAYSTGGFPVLSKWLSYRGDRDLTDDDLTAFGTLARRVRALRSLQTDCDEHHAAALAQRLDTVD